MARRSKGEGSIYKDKNGFWNGAVTLPSGKRRVKRSKVHGVVKDWVITERKKISDGIYVADDKIIVSSFLERYLVDYCKRRLRATTFQGYKQVIEGHIVPDLGKIKLSQLRPDQINHLLAKKLDAGLSDRWVEYIHGILKRSLNVAVKWGLLVRNPVTQVTPPKVKLKPPTVWDRAQVKFFLDSLEGDRWGAIYYLALTGMRKGEIVGLPLSALDLDKGYLMVVQTLQYLPGQGLLIMEPKTENSKRRIKLPLIVKGALKTHLVRRQAMSQNPSWKESGLVFTTDIGTPIFPRNLLRHFKTKLALLGLPDIRFHDLRHTVASLLFEENTHPKLVSELFGHSSVKVTLDRYSHLINPINSVVADTIDDVFKV